MCHTFILDRYVHPPLLRKELADECLTLHKNEFVGLGIAEKLIMSQACDSKVKGFSVIPVIRLPARVSCFQKTGRHGNVKESKTAAKANRRNHTAAVKGLDIELESDEGTVEPPTQRL